MDMKGWLMEDGSLMIFRKTGYKVQYCKFVQRIENGEEKGCGDHCPLFGEPEKMGDKWYLTVCEKRVLIFSELKDRRE